MPARKPDRSRPKAPMEPRFESLEPVQDLGATNFVDDALIAELDIASLALDSHSAEFLEFAHSRIAGGSLANSDWYKTNWHDLEFSGVDCANASCVEASWHRLTFTNARLTGIDLSTSTLHDVTFRNCVLDLASFRMASLQRVHFVDCRMHQVDFSHAKLSDVTISGCDLTQSQFHQLSARDCLIEDTQLAAAAGIASLRGFTISPLDLLELTGQLADALGIRLATDS